MRYGERIKKDQNIQNSFIRNNLKKGRKEPKARLNLIHRQPRFQPKKTFQKIFDY